MDTLVFVGLVVSVLGVFPLFLGGILDIVKVPVVIKNTEHIGFDLGLLTPFGVIKILIVVLTLIPVTSLIGAILATGWMGGAIASHVRVKDKYIIQVIIPILIWIGFGLRHQQAMHIIFGI